MELWQPSLTSFKSRYSEGELMMRLIRLSRRDRRVVAEFTTVISVWVDTIDMVIKIMRESTMCLKKRRL